MHILRAIGKSEFVEKNIADGSDLLENLKTTSLLVTNWHNLKTYLVRDNSSKSDDIRWWEQYVHANVNAYLIIRCGNGDLRKILMT